MHLKSKHLVLLLLIIASVAAMFTPAMAVDSITKDTPVSLTVEAAIFNVSVPTVLPVNANAHGDITVSNNVRIVNNSWGPVYVAGLGVDAQNGWTIKDYDNANMYAEKVNAKKIAMIINNCKTTSAGSIAYSVGNFPYMEGRGGNNWIGINYFAKLPAHKIAMNKTVPMNVLFTVAWLKDDSPGVPENSNTPIKPTNPEDVVDDSKNVILENIAVTTTPTKTTYTEGETFDSIGMVVTAYYSDGTSKAITDYITNKDVLSVSDANIVVTYNGKSCTTPITVIAKELSSIEVTTAPTKTEYIEGQNFNSIDMVVTATYNDGSTEAVTEYNVTDGVALKLGQTVVTIEYGGKSCTTPVTVNAKELTKIEITTAPTKTTYIKGETFDPAGMVVMAYYNNDTFATVSDYTYPTEPFAEGETSITISYDGKDCALPITITNTVSVPANVTDYYTFTDDMANTGGYKVGLNPNFEVALNRNRNYKDWVAGTSLPNPGNTYEGLPITSMYQLFYNKRGITNLNLSLWDTSNVKDMGLMFAYCSGLSSFNHNFNTNNVRSMAGMFYGCPSLTNLNIRSFNTNNVISTDSMFAYCTDLTSLDFNFDTQNVINMKNMFYGCSNLTSLDVSKFNTNKVTSMKMMFYNCSKLTDLDLNSFDTKNVVDMSQMFQDCSNLTNLKVSNFNTQNVTNMTWMFSNCSNLTTLNLSNFNTNNVTDICNMFYGCSKLASLDVSNFNLSKATNISGMFYNCSGLTTLDLDSFDTTNITDMSNMFNNCCKVTTAYARTQADANKFNSSSGKPETLNFVVK